MYVRARVCVQISRAPARIHTYIHNIITVILNTIVHNEMLYMRMLFCIVFRTHRSLLGPACIWSARTL